MRLPRSDKSELAMTIKKRGVLPYALNDLYKTVGQGSPRFYEGRPACLFLKVGVGFIQPEKLRGGWIRPLHKSYMLYANSRDTQYDIQKQFWVLNYAFRFKFLVLNSELFN